MTKQQPLHEHLAVGFLLTLAGGALDAYSYLNHGQVFAGLQTGNIILLAIHIAQGNLSIINHYLGPLIAFFIGIFATVSIEHHFQKNERFIWQMIVLTVEIIGLIVVAYLSPKITDFWITCLISIIASLQYQTFRRVNGRPFATTMTTGNLRNSAVFLWQAILKKEPESLLKAGETLIIVAGFVLGAIISSLLTPIFHGNTVLFVALILASILGVLLSQRQAIPVEDEETI